MLFLIDSIRQYLKRKPAQQSNQPQTEGDRWDRNNHRGRLRSGRRGHRDSKSFPINTNAHLEVFWKDEPHGRGPGISCFIKDEQILRVDCFGKDLGHLHTSCFMPTQGEKRLYLPELTRTAQIERAIFEVCRNLAYYQVRAANPESRAVVIELDKVHQAAHLAQERMLFLLEAIEVLRDSELN